MWNWKGALTSVRYGRRGQEANPYQMVLIRHLVYALAKFECELEAGLTSVSGEIDSRRRRVETIDAELGRLAEAVAMHGATTALMNAIAERESERRAIDQILWGAAKGSVQSAIADVREFALNQLKQIRHSLQAQAEAARFELSSHVKSGIVMRPTVRGDARFYTAEGDWELVGKYEGRSPETALRNLEMVAGVRFELTTFGL